MKSTVTVRLTEDMRVALAEVAKRQNRPASDVVRDSLRRYLAKELFQKSRDMTLPFAEAQGFLTDEDVFITIS